MFFCDNELYQICVRNTFTKKCVLELFPPEVRAFKFFLFLKKIYNLIIPAFSETNQSHHVGKLITG